VRMTLIACVICLTAGSLSATTLQEQLLSNKTIISDSYPLISGFTFESDYSGSNSKGRSRFLKSLLVPGWGQLEEGHWIKASIYLAVEATFITGAVMAHKQGVERDRDFKEYADTHWSFEDYRQNRIDSHEWGSHEEIPDYNYFGEAVTGSQNGSHELPGYWNDGYDTSNDPYLDEFNVDETQQYYEMIGKYAQFGRGWDDYPAGEWRGAAYFSPNNRDYMHLRDLSNESFRLSSNLVMGLLLNHFTSALDQILFGDNGELQLATALTAQSTMVTLQLGF
jgi:hypothetical protein